MLEFIKKYPLLKHLFIWIGIFISILFFMFAFWYSESNPYSIINLFKFWIPSIMIYTFLAFIANKYDKITARICHYSLHKKGILLNLIKRHPLLKHILIWLGIFLTCYLLLIIKFCPCWFWDAWLYHFLALFLYWPPIFGIYIFIVLIKYKYYKTIIWLLIWSILIGSYFVYSNFQSKNNTKKEIEIYEQNKLNQENELLKKGEYYKQYNNIQNNNSLSTSEKQWKVFQLNKSFWFIN